MLPAPRTRDRRLRLATTFLLCIAGCQGPAQPVIALTTDFGASDFYVGAVQGAILSVNPAARLVTISHQVPKYDISQAAYTLWQASEAFPPRTVFLTVVDPGVGTPRRPVAVRLNNGHLHIAPDNGVLSEVIAAFGLAEARLISNEALMRGGAAAGSRTFHGREIFGPVAGHLAAGVALAEVGPTIEDLVFTQPEYGHWEGDALVGRIRTVDGYGNAITNILADTLTATGWPRRGDYRLLLAGRELRMPLAGTYADVALGEALMVFGSSGYLEMALNQGDFAAANGVKPGDRLELSPLR